MSNKNTGYYPPGFRNGISVKATHVQVSFQVVIPSYVPEMDMSISYYKGWSLEPSYLSSDNKKRVVYVTGLLPEHHGIYSAMVVRTLVYESFKVFRNRKPKKKKSTTISIFSSAGITTNKEDWSNKEWPQAAVIKKERRGKSYTEKRDIELDDSVTKSSILTLATLDLDD